MTKERQTLLFVFGSSNEENGFVGNEESKE
jgi:hypothetical protein